MGGDCVDHEVDRDGERVVDVVGEAEVSTELEVDEASQVAAVLHQQRNRRTTFEAWSGSEPPQAEPASR